MRCGLTAIRSTAPPLEQDESAEMREVTVWSKWTVVILTTAILGPGGCGGGSDKGDSAAGTVTVQLAEQNDSGQSGTATFTAIDGERTRIVLELTSPPDGSQPAHVHRGSCDDLGHPVISLTSVEDGTSGTEAEMSLERLRQGDLVIHAHKSEAEYDTSVACAPIEPEGEGGGA